MRARASNNVANFDMPVAATAWLFLEAMNIPRAVWPLLFNAFGGRLPINDDQLDVMMTAIRQQGHIAEHTHAGPRDLYEGIRGSGRHGTGHYNTWDMSHGSAEDAYWQDGDASWSAEWPTESYHGATPYDDNDYYYDEDGYAVSYTHLTLPTTPYV